MNIKQAKEEVKNTVRAYLSKDKDGQYRIPAIRQRPMLLMGPPGIGKTQIMEQIARELKIGLTSYTITHHTRQSAVGLPFIKGEEFDGQIYSVTEYTMSEIIASIYRNIRDKGQKEGILFIDEINCVSETLAPTMLQFLQCKTFGNQAVPAGWVIVAAGNPPEYNRSVRDFDMVTLDRVRYLTVDANLAVWREYANRQKVHPAILSYLELKPDNFYRVEADVDGIQFVTARGWEDLSSLLYVYEDLKISVGKEVMREFLQHEEVAGDMAAYYDLYNKYRKDYGVSDILAGRVNPEVYQKIEAAAVDERLSLVNLLLEGLKQSFAQAAEEKYITDHWYEHIREYHHYLGRSDHPGSLYQELLQKWEKSFFIRRNSGFYTREEEAWQRTLLGLMLENEPDAGKPVQVIFDETKKSFETQCAKLEQIEQNTAQSLAYAFDFMEAAFEKGQEMVVFVTELTVCEDAVKFLAEHECARYADYRDNLLVGVRKAKLLAELKQGLSKKQK